jgi:hypothetical protein
MEGERGKLCVNRMEKAAAGPSVPLSFPSRPLPFNRLRLKSLKLNEKRRNITALECNEPPRRSTTKLLSVCVSKFPASAR